MKKKKNSLMREAPEFNDFYTNLQNVFKKQYGFELSKCQTQKILVSKANGLNFVDLRPIKKKKKNEQRFYFE